MLSWRGNRLRTRRHCDETDNRLVPRSTESTKDLRNQFAGQAIVGVLSNPELLEFVDKEFPHMATREAAARYAFAVADSMLKVSKEV